MTTERRHRNLTVQGDRITDEDAVKWWIASMARPQVRVARLSEQDPAIQAFEATARGSRAA